MAVGSVPAGGFATPPGKASGLGGLIASRRLPYLAARLASAIGRAHGRPLRFGSIVLAARYQDVAEVLSRDLDFILHPINAPRFDEIGFHFILGMDRSAELSREREPLYAALARVDFDRLRTAAAADIAARLEDARAIDVVEGLARPVAAATASRLFGIAPLPSSEFMDAARAIFNHCFLNAAGDKAVRARALAAAAALTDWLDAELAQRRRTGELGADMMGALLAAGFDDDLTRRTLGGMLVGSIDTTATVVAKVVAVLMDDPELAAAATADSADPARMYGWCLEALRRWPHAPLLVRQSAVDTRLAGTGVRAGDKVLLLTEAAMLDPDAFPAPFRLEPTRPVDAYLHFGQGLHPCAGRAINAWQIPMLVGAILSRGPVRRGRVRWAGPFPAHLEIRFGGRA